MAKTFSDFIEAPTGRRVELTVKAFEVLSVWMPYNLPVLWCRLAAQHGVCLALG